VTLRRIIAMLVVLVLASLILITLVLAVFRDRLFDLYMRRLDSWVTAGGNAETVQSELVDTCGSMVLTQAGGFERIQLLTFYLDEFDFRVNVCV